MIRNIALLAFFYVTLLFLPGGMVFAQSSDLAPTALSVPSTAFPGSTLKAYYTTTNTGAALGNVAYWENAFYLSQSPTFDIDTATLLGTGYQAYYTWGGASSYRDSVELEIPEGLSGQYYIFVVIDHGNLIEESDKSNNVGRSNQIAISSDGPNLVITGVTAPALAVPGTTIDVHYSMRNTGTVAIPAGSITNALYLSTDTSRGSDSEVSLPSDIITDGIGVGESLARVVSVTVPNISGLYHILIEANANGAITEIDLSNNVGHSKGIAINLTRPDLIATNLRVGGDVATGNAVHFSYVLRNVGDTVMSAGFCAETIKLFSDSSATGGTEIGFEFHVESLAPGDSIVVVDSAYLPSGVTPGRYYLAVVVDAANFIAESNEDNNLSVSSAFEIGLTGPDLIVTSVDVPSSAFSGHEIEIHWAVKNIGSSSTVTPQWFDVVYLSPTAEFDSAGSVRLGIYQNAAYLPVGGSYSNSQTVKLPNGIAGKFYVVVAADDYNFVPETNNSNNRMRTVDSIQIGLSPAPDLRITSFAVPALAFSGDTINVHLVVTNKGAGPTDVADWFDMFYFSFDSVLIMDTAKYVGGDDHRGVLSPESSYTVDQRVILPYGKAGHGYLYVSLDHYNYVYEYTGETNNIGRGGPISITLAPPPDLAVTSVRSSRTGTSGQFVGVSWTVKNEGQSSPQEGVWIDRVYLGRNTRLNPDSAYVLGSFQRYGDLEPDSVYSRNESVRLPDGVQGEYAMYVKADWNGAVFENGTTENNTARAESTIVIGLAPWADLNLTAFSAPLTVAPGQRVSVAWTVQNLSSARPTVPLWNDRVYLLGNRQFDAAATYFVQASVAESLIANGSYSLTASAVLPFTLPDTLYWIIVSDADSVVYEHGNEANNAYSLGPVHVVPAPMADLVMGNISAPTNGVSGEQARFRYAVTNSGNGAVLASRWTDGIFVSTDSLFPVTNRIRVGSVDRFERLEPNESYTRDISLPLPNGLTGTFFVGVLADTERNVNEGNRENNLRSAPQKISIALAPSPDLHPSVVFVPPSFGAGQEVWVHWTVRNLQQVASKDTTWNDAVYISTNSTFDLRDLRLATRTRRGIIPGGGSYQDSAVIVVPSFATGNLFLLVQTDSRDEIYEGASGEGNNVIATSVDVGVSAPCDLSISSITAPVQLAAGTFATVDWRLGNAGPNDARGYITEAVYVSADSIWDVHDPILGTFEHSVDIPVGKSVPMSFKADIGRAVMDDPTGTIEGAFPGVSPGPYHIIVRTDLRNTFAESNEDNNTAIAPVPTQVTVPVLKLGVLGFGKLGKGQSLYYRLDSISAGQTVRINLSSSNQFASHELYARYGSVPTRRTFDYSYQAPFAQNQEILIPETQGGTYYVLIYGDNVPGDTSDYKIIANVVQFSVSSVSPNIGGKTGEVTIVVSGARFDAGTTIRLVGPNGATPPLLGILSRSSSHIEGTFDLKRNAPLGVYDVVAIRADSSRVTLKAGFTVVPGTAFSANLGFVPPSSIFIGGSGFYAINFENSSNIDIPFFSAYIVIPAGTEFTVNSDRLLTMGASIPDSIRAKFKTLDGVETDDGWMFIPLVARHVRPGEKLSVALQVRKVFGDEFPIQIFASGQSRAQFIENQLTIIELARQNALSAPEGTVDPFLLLLAQHPDQFMATILQAYVDLGYLNPEDIMGLTNADITAAAGRIMLLPKIGPGDFRSTLGMRCTDKVNLAKFAFTAAKLVVSAFSLALAPVTGGASLIMFAVSTAGVAMDAKTFLNGESNFLTKLICGLDPRTPTRIVRSKDPNDMQGPGGYGDKRWVGVTNQLPYTIQFENDPKLATAAAQSVKVTMPFDTTVDMRSFRLGTFGFGKYLFSDASGRSTYNGRLDLRDSLGFYVDVVAGADLTRKEAFWVFSTIDPATGIAPVSPEMGFLPVDDSTHRGQGFVTFSMRPKVTSATGSRINEKARIVFDINDPIDTPPVFNTIDAGIPTSAVTSIARVAATNDFTVFWHGLDDSTGSGMGTYSLFVSVDDGGYTPWLTGVKDTSATFHGSIGKQYRFYTLAIDNAGNVQPGKSTPDAQIILNGVETAHDGLPREFALDQNYPNPFNPTTLISYALPSAARVTLAVYNVLGQRVALIANGDVQDAGYKRAAWNASNVASGVYFYRLEATSLDGALHSFTQSKKMLLIR